MKFLLAIIVGLLVAIYALNHTAIMNIPPFVLKNHFNVELGLYLGVGLLSVFGFSKLFFSTQRKLFYVYFLIFCVCIVNLAYDAYSYNVKVYESYGFKLPHEFTANAIERAQDKMETEKAAKGYAKLIFYKYGVSLLHVTNDDGYIKYSPSEKDKEFFSRSKKDQENLIKALAEAHKRSSFLLGSTVLLFFISLFLLVIFSVTRKGKANNSLQPTSSVGG